MSSSSMSIPSFLPSTGQTAEDIRGIIEMSKFNRVPLSSPPALYDPTYKPPSTGGHLVPVIIVSVILCCAMVGLRLVSTHKHGRTSSRMLMYIEDWLILFGLIIFLGLAGFAFAGVYRWQWGWKTIDAHFENLVFNYKAFYIWFMLNMWASNIIRASLILTVRRLYTPLKTKMIKACDALICIKLIFGVAASLGLTFNCGPNLDIMNLYKFSYSCNGYIFSISVCAIAIIVDLAIIILPMPLIGMLRNVTLRKKVEVCAIFSLGFLAVAASCARLIEMIRFMQPMDRNYNSTYMAVACLLDLTLALCTSCIPSARVLFSRLYSPDSLFSVKAYFRRRPSVHEYASRLRRFRKGSAGSTCTAYSCEKDTEEKRYPYDLSTPEPAVIAGESSRQSQRPLSGGIFDNRPRLSKSDSQLHIDLGKVEKGFKYPSTAVRAQEDEEDVDDIEEFDQFQIPVPSDNFFPYATALSPRPSTRASC